MKHENLVSRIAHFSLTHKVSMFVLFLTVVAVGLIATSRLPLEMEPRGRDSHHISTDVSYPVGVPQETMEKISIPMEEELSTVRGIKRISSYAHTGGAGVRIEFKYGTDMDVAYREVRDRVERARARFPEGVDRPRIRKWKPGSSSVVGYRLSYDMNKDYYDLVNKYIVTPLQRIPGVADVDFRIRRREIRIELDQDRAEAAGVNIKELGNLIRSDNFTLSSGTVTDGGKKYTLKSSSEFRTIDEFRHIPIKENVFLKDIATVSYVPEEARHMYRFNGKPASHVSIKREGEANTVEVSQRVVEVVEEMKENPRLSGFEFRPYTNQGEEIIERLGNLIGNGRLGALLAGAVLFFFLRQFRLTLVIALAIPLCLMIALTTLYFAGETLNSVTIMGLVICVGLLVDNSVVIAENIHRHYQNGLSRAEACLRGVSELGFAITIATLTTLIVFGSGLLSEGDMKFYLEKITLPIISSITASLAVALMFIPLCVYLTLPRNRDRKRMRTPSVIMGEFFLKIYLGVFERINQAYHVALRFFLRRRLDLSVVLIAMLSATFMLGGSLNFDERNDELMERFQFRIRFPDSYSMEDRLAYMQKAEKLVLENNDDYGLEYFTLEYSGWDNEFRGAFAHDRVHPLTREEAVDKLFDDFPEEPGVRVQYRGKEGAEEKDDSRQMHYVRLVGQDPEQLKRVAEDLKPTFERIPGVLAFVDEGTDEGPSEMSLLVDRDRASSLGVDPRILTGTIQSAVTGDQLPRFNNKGRQVPVRLRFEDADRGELSDLHNFQIPAADGRIATVGEVTRIAFQKSEDGYISRRNKQMSEWFGMRLENSPNAWQVKKTIEETKAQIDLPDGVSFDETRIDFGDEEHKQGGIMIGLSILFVYMLMAFFFESTLIPLSIILTIPLASVGAILALKMTNTFIDQMAYMGGMLLVGIVVNNGIVLVDYTNRLRREGKEREEALALATQHRFRPIVMTALTTICGMIPLTFGDSEGMGASFKAFGLVLIGGMTTATLFTLVVVPVFYTLIEDSRIAFNNILASVFDRSAKVSDSAPAR